MNASYHRCFSSLGCPALSVREIVSLASAHGIPLVELRCASDSLDLPLALKQEFGSPKDMADWLLGAPVRVVALDTSLVLSALDEKTEAAFHAHLPWAEALGGLRLRVFDGSIEGDSVARSRAVAFLKTFSARRAKEQIKSLIMIETHDSLFTSKSIESFMGETPDDTGLLWDAHHTWKKGDEAPSLTWQAAKKYVVHIHVKDSCPRPESHEGYEYVVPGAGTFPMASLIETLTEDDYNGPLSLEWERKWVPSLPPLEAALAGARERQWW